LSISSYRIRNLIRMYIKARKISRAAYNFSSYLGDTSTCSPFGRRPTRYTNSYNWQHRNQNTYSKHTDRL